MPPAKHLAALLALSLALTAQGANPAANSRGAASAPATQLPPEPPAALIPAHGAASNSFAHSWTEAFVTGNGTMGAMVMGAGMQNAPPRPQEDTVFFSHNQLFLPLGTKEVVPQLGDSLDQIRQLIRTRGYGPAINSAFAIAQQQGFPGATCPDPYLPALELKLKMPAAGTPRAYLRTENFATGEVAVRWTDDSGTFIRKLFISRADNVAALWIGPAPESGQAAAKVSCEFWIPTIPMSPVRTYLLNNPTATPAEAAASALIRAASNADSAGINFHAQYREGRGSGYDAAVRIIADGGTSETANGHVVIKDAGGILVLLRIAPFARSAPGSDRAVRRALNALDGTYDTLLQSHVKLHGALFDRVALNVASQADRAITTDALLALAKSGKTQFQPALLEKLYEASRYAMLCGTGDRPPNLQGLWAGTWSPSVSSAGDYGLDASLHLAVASALSGGTPESLLGLFNLCDRSLNDWQTNAHNLYGVRGILVPTHQSSNGKNLDWSDRSPGPFCWTVGASLLAHWYFDYYLYTGDRQFLAQRAVPFMKQAALFYEDYLTADAGAGGKYRFSPSDSTNNAPGDNSAIDIEAASELFTNLIAACQMLHIEAEAIPRWQKILAGMPPLLVASDGQLQEWALPGVTNKPMQKHIPHLYDFYQGVPLDPQRDPELQAAAHAAFQQRFNQWFHAANGNDAASQQIADRLQMGLCAASFGDGAQVGEVLARIASRNAYPSLMTQRTEDGRTFSVDAAGAVPEILNRALLQSRPGSIDLLPALPPALTSGEVHGLAARSVQPETGPAGQIRIDTLRWSPTAIDLTLTSTIDQTLSIHLPKTAQGPAVQTAHLTAGQTASLHFPQR